MQKTTNYQLNQWEASDRVTRADFNADNLAIDAALKAVADAAGNCKIAFGSYTGTGTYGESNPNTLTFDFEPKAMFILHSTNATIALFMRGCIHYWNTGVSISYNSVTWQGNSVSWYTTANSGTGDQMNGKSTYYYVAIG